MGRCIMPLFLGCPSGQNLNCYHWSRASWGPKDHQHCFWVTPPPLRTPIPCQIKTNHYQKQTVQSKWTFYKKMPEGCNRFPLHTSPKLPFCCHSPPPFLLTQNHEKETALHCAAQYGHSDVVSVLLHELTDPTMRNSRQETPLDLAALYGRLEVSPKNLLQKMCEKCESSSVCKSHTPTIYRT